MLERNFICSYPITINNSKRKLHIYCPELVKLKSHDTAESNEYRIIMAHTNNKNHNELPSKYEPIGRLNVCTSNPAPTQYGNKIPIQNYRSTNIR